MAKEKPMMKTLEERRQQLKAGIERPHPSLKEIANTSLDVAENGNKIIAGK